MKIQAHDIEIQESLSQRAYDGKEYDLHNDFYCTQIKFSENVLNLVFNHTADKKTFILHFQDVEISDLNFITRKELLTIDTIYRGRAEVKKGELTEFIDAKGYFYIEFVEDITLEFWSSGIVTEVI